MRILILIGIVFISGIAEGPGPSKYLLYLATEEYMGPIITVSTAKALYPTNLTSLTIPHSSYTSVYNT